MMVSAAAAPPAPQIKRARQSVQHRRRPIDFGLEEGKKELMRGSHLAREAARLKNPSALRRLGYRC